VCFVKYTWLGMFVYVKVMHLLYQNNFFLWKGVIFHVSNQTFATFNSWEKMYMNDFHVVELNRRLIKPRINVNIDILRFRFYRMWCHAIWSKRSNILEESSASILRLEGNIILRLSATRMRNPLCLVIHTNMTRNEEFYILGYNAV
jgi:hypothetical protein